MRFVLLVALMLSSQVAHAQQGQVFPGEKIQEAAGFPAITRFFAGDPERPLIVFVPGAHHTARVAYGGHEGARAEDFLAHWLNKKGYNFLAISYPIDTAEGGIETDHPDFMIRDWGRQAALLAKAAVAEHGLSGEVIVAAWSMGGKIVQSVWEAMRAEGVNMSFYISVTATPPLPGLIVLSRELPMLESGYADRRKDFARWYGQVAANGKAMGREIVSKEIFMAHYQGDIPVNLQGYGQQYRDGAYVMDHLASQADAKPFAYGDFPLVAMLVPNGRGDRRHALTDQAAWSVYNANTLFKRWLSGNKIDVKTLSDEKWTGLLKLSRSLDDRLSVYVEGNHFFFVGEDGARRTADAIAELETRVAAVKAEASALLGVAVE